jgi:hypothetical protein
MIPLVHPSESFAPIQGCLTYELGDYSFRFVYATEIVPARAIWPGGVATLCFGQLQVDLHLYDGQWLGADGYTNHEMWTRCRLSAPEPVISCGLFLEDFAWAQRGVGYGVDDAHFENRYFDAQSGWFCTGDLTARATVVVQFATNCFASMRDGRVVAIWLHPENWRCLRG